MVFLLTCCVATTGLIFLLHCTMFLVIVHCTMKARSSEIPRRRAPMAKTSSAAAETNDFFKPDYFKVPDFGQFQADFNRWVGDFSKSFSNGKAPAVDLEGVF